MTDQPGQSSSKNTTDAEDVVESSRMSFGDHLEELRDRLIKALVGVVLASIISLVFGRDILEIIYRPLLQVQFANDLQPSLQVLAPPAAFIAYLKIGFLSGLILAMPWVTYQIWLFVATGLFQKERRFMMLLLPATTGLFVVGVLFLYFIVLPIVLNFFISFNKRFEPPGGLSTSGFRALLLPDRPEGPAVTETAEAISIPLLTEDPATPSAGDMWVNVSTRRLMVNTSSGIWSMALEPGTMSPAMHSQFALDFYISFVLMLALAFGIAFETPVVVFFLAWTGIVTTAAMGRARRYVLFGTVIAAAMLTPPDVISQLLLAGPMYLLFELGILVARTVERPPTTSSDE
jgi:sec-independent protein translocase protein TatC